MNFGKGESDGWLVGLCARLLDAIVQPGQTHTHTHTLAECMLTTNDGLAGKRHKETQQESKSVERVLKE